MGVARDLRHPELAEARALVLEHGRNATCYQVLNPGIRRWLTPGRDALVGYVPYGGWWLVAGEPICAVGRRADVAEEFRREALGRGSEACFFCVGDGFAEELGVAGRTHRLAIGAQPVWDPTHWPTIVSGKASLRAQLHRARNKGVVVERLHSPSAVELAGLERVLAEWLDSKGLPPLHFLVEPDTLGRLQDRRLFVARRAGPTGAALLAFLVASPIPRRDGCLVEQTVRLRRAPNGTSELLLDAAARDAAARGDRLLTLGLSPLSERAGAEPPEALRVRLLLRWVRAHANRFYNFRGLDAYKSKFQPQRWEPQYAVSRKPLGLRALRAVAGAFGGTDPVRLALRAVGRAAVQELRWLWRR